MWLGPSPRHGGSPCAQQRHRTQDVVPAILRWASIPLAIVLILGLATTRAKSGPQPATRSQAEIALTEPPRQLPSGGIPGLGPRTGSTIPAGTRTVVLVRGVDLNSANSAISLWTRGTFGWQQLYSWSGHNGARGWSANHRENDLRSPIGTYTLSDAGGKLPNPGTQLPYYQSELFTASGSSLFGDSLAGTFDYVIAIDYNRALGVSPLNRKRPLGESRGGGIWLHIDHDGPTHGCIAIPRTGLKLILARLRAEDNPRIVMGPHTALIL